MLRQTHAQSLFLSMPLYIAALSTILSHFCRTDTDSAEKTSEANQEHKIKHENLELYQIWFSYQGMNILYMNEWTK